MDEKGNIKVRDMGKIHEIGWAGREKRGKKESIILKEEKQKYLGKQNQ